MREGKEERFSEKRKTVGKKQKLEICCKETIKEWKDKGNGGKIEEKRKDIEKILRKSSKKYYILIRNIKNANSLTIQKCIYEGYIELLYHKHRRRRERGWEGCSPPNPANLSHFRPIRAALSQCSKNIRERCNNCFLFSARS